MAKLPAERTSFVGRRDELRRLEALLQSGRRLVTVIGPAGVGKTRLALDLGRRHARARGGETVFRVPLQEAHTAAAVAGALAVALELPLPQTTSVAELTAELGLVLVERGPALVILDNFEHLVPFAEETVGRWLDVAPEASFLVTSRHVLGIAGEQRFAVEPLAPEDAIALFLDRARLARPDLEAGPERLQVIRRLVEQLDRLSLTVELAASRAAILSPEEIAARIGERLDLLQTDGQQPDPFKLRSGAPPTGLGRSSTRPTAGRSVPVRCFTAGSRSTRWLPCWGPTRRP
jgi:predicted ATPase